MTFRASMGTCRPWLLGTLAALICAAESTPLARQEAADCGGPASLPGEFAGSNARCGAVVVWTK